MANKTTRLTLTLPATKPRNPVMVAALTRCAGSHQKPHKTERQHARQHLQRSLNSLLQGDETEFDVD